MMRRASIALVVSALVLAHVSAVAAHGGQEGIGELRIEGQGIEELVLTGAGDRKSTFAPPGPTVTLPPGVYFVHTVRLEGGHYSQSYMIPRDLRVTVDANSPVTLKVGAPLRQVVKIERQGSAMVLNYELVGQGGERYAISRNQDAGRPAFAVYRGDEKVASGDFEFG